ncbi:EamA family transporter [Photobacterium sp. BZF1]|uniref:DMT family transporter n=1 Tax=Photobacterium sp. BZF1 TaxID=1904457 RepID=UPI0016539AC4|nr:EamA family transporter [Photobacterium sp. BZF1]MBC7002677.1 EamA family transporter [Photobacterium sp. BZF1]
MLHNRVNPYHLGIISILFASTLWGTTGTVASLAPEISSLAIGAFSMGGGGLLQAFIARKHLRSGFRQISRHKGKLVVSAIALAIYPLVFYSSMRFAGVAIGTVISIATAPFFTVMLECLFSKEKTVSKKWLTSFLVGTAGILLLVFSESSSSSHFDSNLRLIGIILGLVAGMSYAIYSWVAKTMIDEGVPSQAALGSIFGIGALMLLPTLLITGDNLLSSTTNVMVIGYMALIPMGLGYIAYGFGLRFVTASSATLMTLFEPVVAAGLAVLIVGESIPVLGWCGIGLILICLLMQARG